jgi:hypothetical protein
VPITRCARRTRCSSCGLLEAGMGRVWAHSPTWRSFFASLAVSVLRRHPPRRS